jgi:hypothetical protein
MKLYKTEATCDGPECSATETAISPEVYDWIDLLSLSGWVVNYPGTDDEVIFCPKHAE